jgi:glycosyltransferase involved in cell wall biosynthesis
VTPASNNNSPALPIELPLVTIVVVNYNYGAYVDRAIASVDEQDYPHIQCIVVDCASSDNSLAVIDVALTRAKHSFFRVERLGVNVGPMINSLSVLKDIKGAFVAFLDADDFLFPSFVSTHVKAHLNCRHSAALSVTDQIQIDAGGQVLAGTCHWHQKWRASETGSAWIDGTADQWVSPSQDKGSRQLTRLHYVPASWNSWLLDNWIWSTTSGILFRKSVISTLNPPSEGYGERRDLAVDAYLARFGHAVGGTLLIDDAQGAYRRHGKNIWSTNAVLGGHTPNATRDNTSRLRNVKQAARELLMTKHTDLLGMLGAELYYSIAWQVSSREDYLKLVKDHAAHRTVWEKWIKSAPHAT